MTRQPLGLHGATHLPDGQDQIPGLIYIDDQILADPGDTITFTGFPSDRVVLELTWNAWLVSGATTPALMYVVINGPDAEDDYFWTLAGTVELDTDSGGSDTRGGLAFLNDPSSESWGRVRFPDYNRNVSPDGRSYVGEAGYAISGGGTPDTWLIAGYQQDGNPITELQVVAWSTPGDSVQNFDTGSRFILTAY